MVEVGRRTSAYRPLGVLVYEDIRQAIIGGRFRPRQRLVAAKIAEELGVSRAPVALALKRLQSEGFVEGDPHKAIAVSDLSAERIRESYAMRCVLEALAVREAAGRISAERLSELRQIAEGMARFSSGGQWHLHDGHFHRRLREESGMPFLTATLNNLYDRCEYFRTLCEASPGLDRRQSIEEHLGIVAALEAGDGERAAALMTGHLERSATTIVSALQRSSAENVRAISCNDTLS